VLTEFHDSLRTLVYDRGKIAADDVDVAFEAPLKAWVGARTRPTLSFFLFDIWENTDLIALRLLDSADRLEVVRMRVPDSFMGQYLLLEKEFLRTHRVLLDRKVGSLDRDDVVAVG
jgi:hypothetical protein